MAEVEWLLVADLIMPGRIGHNSTFSLFGGISLQPNLLKLDHLPAILGAYVLRLAIKGLFGFSGLKFSGSS